MCSLLSVRAEEDMDGNIPEKLARELKEKSVSSPEYSDKTKKLLDRYGVNRISQLPKKAESVARKVLGEVQK